MTPMQPRFPFKLLILIATFALCCVRPAAAQQPATILPNAAPTPVIQKGPAGPEDDRFPALRENADQLKAIYEKLHNESMNDVDRLLKDRHCQIKRIGGLLDRTLESMRNWYDQEMTYWTTWGEVEQQRVEGQKKGLAGMEVDQKRAKDLIASESQDREKLVQYKANLEKNAKRTQGILKEIDALVMDIKESEAHLAQAQKDYDDITLQVNNMNASITARLIDIRQSRHRIEAYGLEVKSFYETKRASAQEICNSKQPNSGRPPLPKAPRQKLPQ